MPRRLPIEHDPDIASFHHVSSPSSVREKAGQLSVFTPEADIQTLEDLQQIREIPTITGGPAMPYDRDARTARAERFLAALKCAGEINSRKSYIAGLKLNFLEMKSGEPMHKSKIPNVNERISGIKENIDQIENEQKRHFAHAWGYYEMVPHPADNDEDRHRKEEYLIELADDVYHAPRGNRWLRNDRIELGRMIVKEVISKDFGIVKDENTKYEMDNLIIPTNSFRGLYSRTHNKRREKFKKQLKSYINPSKRTRKAA